MKHPDEPHHADKLLNVIINQKLAHQAVEAAKRALVVYAHKSIVSHSSQPHEKATLEALGLSDAQKKALVNDPSMKAVVQQLLTAADHKKNALVLHEEKKTELVEHIEQKHEIEATAEHHEPENSNEPDDGNEHEQDGVEDDSAEHEQGFDPEHPDIDLHDVKDLAHDAEALKHIDINAWQHELMDTIKQMPSVSDQAAWMYMVSQLNSSNMAFRTEGAAYLMQSVANHALPAEEQMVAFAGAEALRDPSSSLFEAAPGSLKPGSGLVPESKFSPAFSAAIPQMGHVGKMNSQGGVSDDEVEDMIHAHAHKNQAPFSLIDQDGGRIADDLSHFTHDPKKMLMAQFKQNNDVTERLDVPQQEEMKTWEQPKKTKALFDLPTLKPTADFFKAVSGRSES